MNNSIATFVAQKQAQCPQNGTWIAHTANTSDVYNTEAFDD